MKKTIEAARLNRAWRNAQKEQASEETPSSQATPEKIEEITDWWKAEVIHKNGQPVVEPK